jgi:hypothetical protein
MTSTKVHRADVDAASAQLDTDSRQTLTAIRVAEDVSFYKQQNTSLLSAETIGHRQ